MAKYKEAALMPEDVDKLDNQLELIAEGKPQNVFIAAHYLTDKDDCPENTHKEFDKHFNFAFKLSLIQIQELFQIMLKKVLHG